MQYIYNYQLFLFAGTHSAMYHCLWCKKTDEYKMAMNTHCNEHSCCLKSKMASYFYIQGLEINHSAYPAAWHRHRPRKDKQRPAQSLSQFFFCFLFLGPHVPLPSLVKPCSPILKHGCSRNNVGRKHVFLCWITGTQDPTPKLILQPVSHIQSQEWKKPQRQT